MENGKEKEGETQRNCKGRVNSIENKETLERDEVKREE